MSTLNPLANIPPGSFLYFHYGLAFIFLGCAIAAKDMKGSRLKLAGSLRYLALFGFLHGTHEWLELYLLIQGSVLTSREVLLTKCVELAFGTLSFIFLLQFGMILLYRIAGNRWIWLRWLHILIFVFWMMGLFFLWQNAPLINLNFVSKVDMLTRNIFAITGSLTAGVALIVYSQSVKSLSRNIASYLLAAGVVFACYGIIAGLIPSKTILPFLSLPVELIRTVAAILITIFIVKALNVFDIETRKKLLEQMEQLAQSERLASLGQLAAGVAHEINNPLTNASLSLQILKNNLSGTEGTSETIMQKLAAVDRNINRASTIARELLQFSRNDGARFEPLHVNEVIQNALAALQYKLPGLKIVRQLGDLPEIMGDHGRLRQVFINILNNSLEAMDTTGTITLTTTHIGNKVKVEISDTGKGMTRDETTRLFDPFYTTKEVGMGTGLGLSICYGIIQQHSGQIEINSIPNRLTTVTIEFPTMEEYEKNSYH